MGLEERGRSRGQGQGMPRAPRAMARTQGTGGGRCLCSWAGRAGASPLARGHFLAGAQVRGQHLHLARAQGSPGSQWAGQSSAQVQGW